MTIYIPRALLVSAGVLCCAALIGLVIRQAPEFTRYAKIEGM